MRFRSNAQDTGHCGKGKNARLEFSDFIVLSPHVNLIEKGYVAPLGKTGDVAAKLPLSHLAFHGDFGFVIAYDDEIQFPPLGITHKPQVHAVSLAVFNQMAVFQEI